MTLRRTESLSVDTFTSTLEQRKEILQMVVDEVIVHRNDNVDITLAIPIESEPTTEDSVTATFLTPSR